jgi:hypothetical protein
LLERNIDMEQFTGHRLAKLSLVLAVLSLFGWGITLHAQFRAPGTVQFDPANGTWHAVTAGATDSVIYPQGGGITQVTVLPATCTAGTTVQLSVFPYTIYNCSATNTFTPISGTAALPPLPVSGLLLDWQFAPGDNPCAEPDYSGNGNASTGCTNTPPTIIAGSGGVTGFTAGAISVPAAITTTGKTFSFYICYDQSTTTGTTTGYLLSNDGYGINFGATISFRNGVNNIAAPFQGGYQIFPLNSNTTNGNTFTVLPIVSPNGCYTVVWLFDTTDRIFINGTEVTITNNGFGPAPNATFLSQFTGVYHLGGKTGSPGNWGNGKVKRFSVWNRVITNSEEQAVANSNASLASNAGAPFTPYIGALTTDHNNQVVDIGDSENTNLSSTWNSTMVINGTPDGGCTWLRNQ